MRDRNRERKRESCERDIERRVRERDGKRRIERGGKNHTHTHTPLIKTPPSPETMNARPRFHWGQNSTIQSPTALNIEFHNGLKSGLKEH